MKKFLALILVVALMFSVAPSLACAEAPQPGWWVHEKGKENGVWTNIEDDVNSLIQQYCEEYCIPGEDGKDGADGKDGIDGKDGKDGKDGIGVASGGTTGQVLGKLSDEDFDTGWIDVLTPSDLEPINNWINNADNRFTNIENRLDTLEETQFILGLNVRLMDTKRTTLEAFADYSTNRSKVDRYGVRLTVKLGKSYEEKLIEQLQAQIAELMAKQ